MKKILALALLMISAAGSRAADSHFFQASLTPDIAIYAKTNEIGGIALNIWGENPQHSFNLGFINGSAGTSGGLSLGLVSYADTYTGLEWSILNLSQKSFVGWQGGLVNVSSGKFTGFQSGWVNLAQEFHGLQLGLVNCSEKLHGVQIGLVNIANNNPWFKEFPDKLATGFPIANWSF
ncbi:MAG: hypothetical protein WCS42_26050 [Verrucomicrobiota bacterium]